MDKYHVVLNALAYRNLDEIFHYIALELEAPDTARRQTDRLWAALRALDTFPQSHQERSIGRYAGKGYRQLLIDNYICIYRIEEQDKIVRIITIQYQGRNM